MLLDEIEKAHVDLFNILLQVMDHGKLTDNNGKKVDFRNVILIMTTNAGASEGAKESIGFGRLSLHRRGTRARRGETDPVQRGHAAYGYAITTLLTTYRIYCIGFANVTNQSEINALSDIVARSSSSS